MPELQLPTTKINTLLPEQTQRLRLELEIVRQSYRSSLVLPKDSYGAKK